MPARHCFVSGIVQGVAYRYFTRDAATRLGLVGWVRNLPDGRVEAFLQGPEASLARCIEAMDAGPPHARVDGVAANPAPEDATLREFTIRR